MDIRKFGWIVTLAAFSALSCGDAVPPPAEGAVYATLTNSGSASNGASCTPYTLILTAGGDVQPSATATGTLLVDGNDGASVECKVKGKGTYEFSAKVASGTKKFNISGTVAADGTGTAAVSLWHPNEFESISDSACIVRLGTGGYLVESGAIWAGINCSKLVSYLNPNIWCTADATIVFKSCDE